MGWELLGFLGVEGLDSRFYGEIREKNFCLRGGGCRRRNPGAQKRGTWGTRFCDSVQTWATRLDTRLYGEICLKM